MKKVIELKTGDTAYKVDSMHYISEVKVQKVEDLTPKPEDKQKLLKITFSDGESIILRKNGKIENKPVVKPNGFTSVQYATTLDEAKKTVRRHYDEKISEIDKQIEELKKERKTWTDLKRKKLRF